MSDSMYGNWSVTDTSIATADYYGTHTGQGIGSTTSSTFAYLSAASRKTVCPVQYFGNSGGVKVQKPGYLQVVGFSNDTNVCLGLGCATDIQYRVLDTGGQPMEIAGMTVAESYSVNNNSNCSGSFSDSGVWSTDSTGTMKGVDEIYWCCPQPSCTLSLNQTFTVNGQPVLIKSADGLTVGTRNTITIVCTNGQASCPGIFIN